jgi:hypothetical protein
VREVKRVGVHEVDRKTVREVKRVGVHEVDRNELGWGRRQEVRRRNVEIQGLLKKLKVGNVKA